MVRPNDDNLNLNIQEFEPISNFDRKINKNKSPLYLETREWEGFSRWIPKYKLVLVVFFVVCLVRTLVSTDLTGFNSVSSGKWYLFDRLVDVP